MTAISLDLSKQPELVWLSRLVADVQVVAREHDLLLVGAQARDLLLMHALRSDTAADRSNQPFAGTGNLVVPDHPQGRTSCPAPPVSSVPGVLDSPWP